MLFFKMAVAVSLHPVALCVLYCNDLRKERIQTSAVYFFLQFTDVKMLSQFLIGNQWM